MKPLELRRHKEIIAFKAEDESITAFHAYNMEIADISPESFAMMTPSKLQTAPFQMSNNRTTLKKRKHLKHLMSGIQKKT